ncbi:hypothetical protein FRB94_007488 [Tulasnella sp. JGI-2019a]|nr:hypothetical protein FRB94_007488 [Tulasnella sp. JGI-2019a]KAG9023326.1 hypothetical protein FRB95_013255 [Tulasnella sp. JGI-2019a]
MVQSLSRDTGVPTIITSPQHSLANGTVNETNVVFNGAGATGMECCGTPTSKDFVDNNGSIRLLILGINPQLTQTIREHFGAYTNANASGSPRSQPPPNGVELQGRESVQH